MHYRGCLDKHIAMKMNPIARFFFRIPENGSLFIMDPQISQMRVTREHSFTYEFIL